MLAMLLTCSSDLLCSKNLVICLHRVTLFRKVGNLFCILRALLHNNYVLKAEKNVPLHF